MTRARVAEVLNRVRPLSLEMIHRLSAGLELPADLLIAGYELREVTQSFTAIPISLKQPPAG